MKQSGNWHFLKSNAEKIIHEAKEDLLILGSIKKKLDVGEGLNKVEINLLFKRGYHNIDHAELIGEVNALAMELRMKKEGAQCENGIIGRYYKLSLSWFDEVCPC